MGSQVWGSGRAVQSDRPLLYCRMVGGTTGGNWKRPVNRMYSYNYQVGENYYLPMTSYLESKSSGASSDTPGPRCFSERIAEYPLCGKSIELYDDKSIQTIRETRQVISSI